MRRALAAFAAVALLAGGAAAEVAHGLLWNRTGLPAVFPLQLKTDPGRDYYVVLREVESGADALAAYAEGGRFFQVLVPPGTYRLHVASGTGWEGEERLFGPETRIVALSEALSFGVQGIGTKRGHIVDLRAGTPEIEARLAPFAYCQVLEVLPRRRPLPDLGNMRPPGAPADARALLPEDPPDRPGPTLDVRQRPCG